MIKQHRTGKYSNMVNRKSAAEYLGVSEGTLAVWASTGRYQLPFIKLGRKVMYSIEALDAFLESRTVTQTC
ncbi:helix-turn-helix domain-containing protein [Vibrio sp. HA2012]|uniref:helix-turn-helix domain-containing protein n=1 Tax=Vibrio sp. HA2012 TaxID=1971595 RepID=UPI001E362F51|nr:helix-turn-helix domain-containing protein [Vibrio sp. HA2012]